MSDEPKNQASDMDAIPRRARLDLHTPAELAIRAAILTVEDAGAHPLLTEAVVLLGQAREKVADFVDGQQTAHDAKQELNGSRDYKSLSKALRARRIIEGLAYKEEIQALTDSDLVDAVHEEVWGELDVLSRPSALLDLLMKRFMRAKGIQRTQAGITIDDEVQQL